MIRRFWGALALVSSRALRCTVSVCSCCWAAARSSFALDTFPISGNTRKNTSRTAMTTAPMIANNGARWLSTGGLPRCSALRQCVLREVDRRVVVVRTRDARVGRNVRHPRVRPPLHLTEPVQPCAHRVEVERLAGEGHVPDEGRRGRGRGRRRGRRSRRLKRGREVRQIRVRRDHLRDIDEHAGVRHLARIRGREQVLLLLRLRLELLVLLQSGDLLLDRLVLLVLGVDLFLHVADAHRLDEPEGDDHEHQRDPREHEQHEASTGLLTLLDLARQQVDAAHESPSGRARPIATASSGSAAATSSASSWCATVLNTPPGSTGTGIRWRISSNKPSSREPPPDTFTRPIRTSLACAV